MEHLLTALKCNAVITHLAVFLVKVALLLQSQVGRMVVMVMVRVVIETVVGVEH